MSYCTIHLDNYNNGVYYNGTEIKGRVECHFDGKTTVRGVKIELICRETNRFTNYQSEINPISGVRQTTRQFIQPKGFDGTIYNTEQILLNTGGTGQVLDEGRSEYPFSFTLPYDSPPTINHRSGCMYHKLKASIVIPMQIDRKDEFIIHVESLVDFNKMPKELQEPVTYSTEQTTCCCWGRSGLTLDVELPKKAFVPGEVVDLKITICNMSNASVDGVTVTFTKTANLTGQKEIETIASLNQHGVGAHSEHTFDLQFTIPEALVVPFFSKRPWCFWVYYLLLVSCKISRNLLDFHLPIRDIIIGHLKWVDSENGLVNNDASAPPFDSSGLPSYSTTVSDIPIYPEGQPIVPPMPTAPVVHNSDGGDARRISED